MGCTICIGCGDCGMKRTLPTVMSCPICGEDVDIYVRVCEACGFKFVSAGSSISAAEKPTNQERKSNSRSSKA